MLWSTAVPSVPGHSSLHVTCGLQRGKPALFPSGGDFPKNSSGEASANSADNGRVSPLPTMGDCFQIQARVGDSVHFFSFESCLFRCDVSLFTCLSPEHLLCSFSKGNQRSRQEPRKNESYWLAPRSSFSLLLYTSQGHWTKSEWLCPSGLGYPTSIIHRNYAPQTCL